MNDIIIGNSYRHKRTKMIYIVESLSFSVDDGSGIVNYRGLYNPDVLWSRKIEEFKDGRFEEFQIE